MYNLKLLALNCYVSVSGIINLFYQFCSQIITVVHKNSISIVCYLNCLQMQKNSIPNSF